MRLLNVYTLEFQVFHHAVLPKYAIASHRWFEDAEASIKDIRKRRNTHTTGYKKVEGYAQFMKHHLTNVQWLWIDTCCINQHSTVELTEAVNSMFKWYAGAEICIAYLVDVQAAEDEEKFRQSAWFTRGWTLQELLASRLVIFTTRDWQVIGHKGHKPGHDMSFEIGPSVDTLISTTTGISESLVRDFELMQGYGIEEVLGWMAGRVTTREEDMSYSLFGILDVNIWLNYGEGEDKARERLLAEVSRKGQSPDTPASSHSNGPTATHIVPFRRDPDFIDRVELQLLRKKLLASAARVALLGLGGVGKSQIAIECCYHVRDVAPGTWVLWVHASTASRFEQSIRSIADQAKIPGRDDSSLNIFKLVHDWLNDSKNGQWLLVLDNADDAKYLFEQTPTEGYSKSALRTTAMTKPLIEYIPAPTHGSVVITTRHREMASRLVDYDEGSIITVWPMEPALALSLLQNKLRQAHVESGEELVAALDYIPLAISQAAAYIHRRLPRCSVHEYLIKLEKSEKSRRRVLDTSWTESRRDLREAKNSILLTWQVSFDHIRQSRSSAAELLSVMSFFNYQGIPISLLRIQEVDGTDDDDNTENSSSGSADDSFEEDVVTLRDYLFISDNGNGLTFEMHRLVQLATRTWLEAHGEYQKCLERSVAKLYAALPGMEYEDWAEWRMFFPHVQMALLSHPPCELENRRHMWLQLAWIYKRAVRYALDRGLPNDAEALAIQSTMIQARLKGERHPDTINSMAYLAATLSDQGRSTEAEQLQIQVLETNRTLFGEENRYTLNSMASLAKTYTNQDRFVEAEKLELQVLELQKHVLGEEDPDTLMTMNNLALTFSALGRLPEAEEMLSQVLELTKQTLGDEHPDTLKSMNNLACIYSEQDRPNEAEKLKVRVLELQTKVLGDEHPSTLGSAASLAWELSALGRSMEAEKLKVRVLELRKKVLGDEHPDTLNSMANLAYELTLQDRWPEAERLQVQVLELQKKVLGEEHPHTMNSMMGLAETYEKRPDLFTSMANLEIND